MPDPKRYDEFVDLLQRATGQILAYINALLLNWNDAEDVFQDSCVVLWQKFDEFRPGTNFLAWASASRRTRPWTSRRAARAAARSGNPRCNRPCWPTSPSATPAARTPDWTPSPVAWTNSADGDRQLVQLCHGDGVPVRQIADQWAARRRASTTRCGASGMVLLECIRRMLDREDRQMNCPRQPIPDEFWPLLDAACAGELTEPQRAELERHLEGNPAARRAFLDHIRLCTQIRLWQKGQRSLQAGLAEIDAMPRFRVRGQGQSREPDSEVRPRNWTSRSSRAPGS